MPPGIFTRGRRGIQAPVGSALAEIVVRTEAELRAAIGRVAATFRVDANGFPLAFGGAIAIVGQFAVASPITIPPRCVGLTIHGRHGGAILATTADQGVLFTVQAQLVTLEKIIALYGASAGTPTAWFNTFCETTDAGFSVGGASVRPNRVRVLGCEVYADRLYVDSTVGGADDVEVVGNRVTEANGTHDPCVVIDSNDCVVERNILTDGGTDAITVSANGQRCRIKNNDLAGGDVTSDSSLGGNVIAENTNSGTITAAGTDAVGLNT